MCLWLIGLYHIVGYFRRILIFGYFKEAFFCENKFPGPTVIWKYILTIKQNAWLDSRDLIIFAAQMRFVALAIFQAVADPESLESETLISWSASNKAANEAVHTGRSLLWNNRKSLISVQIWQCPLEYSGQAT